MPVVIQKNEEFEDRKEMKVFILLRKLKLKLRKKLN